MTHSRKTIGLTVRVAVIGGIAIMVLMTTGCGNNAPVASYGPDLNGVEVWAAHGNPYAIASLTPMQQQRVRAYQASHPGIAPTWGRDAVNVGMGAGAGYLLGSTTSSAARSSAALTTGAATEGAAAIAPEVVPEVIAPAIERGVAGDVLGAVVTTDVVGSEIIGSEVVEGGLGLLEILEGACLIVCW